MIESLNRIDHSAFAFLNGLHTPVMDAVMWYLTNPLLWLPFYLLLLWAVFRTYRTKGFWVLLFVALMITASDQISVVVKDSVMRLRPSQDPSLCCVHLVNGYKGGLYGFYSSHASNTFAIAVLVIVILRKEFCFIAPVVLFWAVVMSYTRIYLGVHYPGDVLAGMMIGCVLGLAFGIGCRVVLTLSRTYN
jgi:undecaprenyl-diphosphatase